MPFQPSSKVLRTRVFEIAEQRGISLTWLARQYGITVYTLSRIKHGEKSIGRKFIEKSCEIFDVPFQTLFFIEDVRSLTHKVHQLT